MLSKNDIKIIKSLSQKKFREEYSLFLVEGEKMVDEALSSEFELVHLCKEEELGQKIMSQISCLKTPSSVLAVLKQRENSTINNFQNGKLYLALDSVRDPGNFGTILRIADWFGIKHIFASEDSVDLYNPKVIQASMGAIFRIKVHYCNLEELLSDASGHINIYGTFLDGKNIYSTSISPEGIIVLGNESFGISQKIANFVNKRLLIPPYPDGSNRSESLNVAIATAVVCAEFRRVSALQIQKEQ